VVSSQKEDLLWIFELEGHQDADCLERIGSTIDVVTHEDIIKAVDVTTVSWSLPDVEEAHEIRIVSMNTSENFHRWLNISDNDRLNGQNINALCCQFNNVLALNRELRSNRR
jgi:hypothetical protein